MNKHVWRHTAAAVLMGTMLLTGCGSNSDENAVSVQAVSDIATINVSGVNRYSGVVESHSVQKVKKSSKKKVAKCYVKEGDVVHKGDSLFRYDISELELELQSMKLELEKMQNEINSYTTQINELTKERNKASANKKLSYSLEIQEAQLDKAEAEYNLKKKQQEYAKLQKSETHTVVHAKISGVVQTVNSDKDSKNYIVIRGNKSYRVKGTASELNIGTLSEGEEVQVISRIDDSQKWSGTIEKISEEQASDNNNDEDMYSDSSNGESATKYEFIVQLDDSDKLLMGQHVYIQPGEAGDSADANALQLSSSYLVQNDDGSYYVWADNGRGKLEKRTVTVGDYNEYTDTYAILDGLNKDDSIAFPEDGLEEGAKTKPYEEGQSDQTEEDNSDTSGLPDGEVPAMSTDGAEG